MPTRFFFLKKEDFAFLHKGNVVGHYDGFIRALFRALILALLDRYAWRHPPPPPLPLPFPPLPLYPSAPRAPQFPPSLLAPQTGSKTVPVLDSVKDRVLRSFCEHRWQDSRTRKLTKKDSALAPLLETEVCSDFGFIEAALKCLHTVYKFCNRVQYPCAGAGDGF